MARILLLTKTLGASAEVLPSLGLLQHQIRILPPEVSALIDVADLDCLLIDSRNELSTCDCAAKCIT